MCLNRGRRCAISRERACSARTIITDREVVARERATASSGNPETESKGCSESFVSPRHVASRVKVVAAVTSYVASIDRDTTDT